MIQMSRFLLIILLIAGASSCGPVKFVKTWKNPEAQPQNWEGEKIAAFVITLMKATRLGAETTLARELTQRGAQGIAGHTLVTLEMARKEPDRAREILESEGVTGAVIMRVVGSNYEVSYSPGSAHYVGTYYTGFYRR